ncbi:hypothetical protein [Tumebacillus permanentifrigoris]|uniref:Uncharacterized protein n=1 Tax=Tumebacillus permanentifrigoris TaxID=378543 RepID=A0A316DD68_9BACL|nr:hypothetical protein [Tumebacillus permanentifrigoris]PWK14453.1 hypothetical protein C7459_105211 [Tumebacillus permanentifrigoris]
MTVCYTLTIEESEVIQSPTEDSFVGGQPKLPFEHEIPCCRDCGAEQSFFFQVAFPEKHVWCGRSMAVFMCTACVEEETLIPRMLNAPLLGADIPAGFLDDYQTNFRILIFESSRGVLKTTYQERVKFKRISLVETDDPKRNDHKLGGEPNWLLGDETPNTYNSTQRMAFLMQLLEGYMFEIGSDAPQQLKLGLGTVPVPMNKPFYRLFLKNQLYFFGTVDQDHPLVYILTQV